MTWPARRPSSLVAYIVTLAVTIALTASSAWAGGLTTELKYAAIVVDANSGEVLYAKKADSPRYPASITKVMTLYLAFEAISQGRLHLNEYIPFRATLRVSHRPSWVSGLAKPFRSMTPFAPRRSNRPMIWLWP